MEKSAVKSHVLNGEIAIIGSGFIGRSWSMLFAGAGYKVTLYDVSKTQISEALKDIQQQLKTLEQQKLLRGKLSADEQFALIKGCEDFKEAATNRAFIVECIPERLEMKIDVFTKLDDLVDEQTILASSTSCIKPSSFTQQLKHRENVIITHPVNPPYYVPLVELVSSPWTKPEVVTKTRQLMEELGQAPVLLNTEVDGFALNRIQYAILNECWNLVQTGVMSATDVDTVMTHGLGRRYAFLGPLLTCHTNANGIEDYMEKYGSGIHHVSTTFQPIPRMNVESCRKIGLSEELFKAVPEDKIGEKLTWRNERLMALAKLKQDMGDQ